MLRGTQAALLLMLHNLGAPFLLLLIVAHILQSKLIPQPGDLDMMETFAGKKAVSKAFANKGRKVRTFEIEDDRCLEDILSALGLSKAHGNGRSSPKLLLGVQSFMLSESTMPISDFLSWRTSLILI